MLFDCALSVEAQWNPSTESFVLSESNLQSFVQSDWDLDPRRRILGAPNGGFLPPKVLNFVIYIPPRVKSPLIFLSKTPSPACVLSLWGGFFILNKKDTQTLSPTLLTETDHQEIAEWTVSQLRVLFGLSETIQDHHAAEGFSDSEIQGLTFHKALKDIESSIRILSALDHLSDDIPNLEIPFEVQDQVECFPRSSIEMFPR